MFNRKTTTAPKATETTVPETTAELIVTEAISTIEAATEATATDPVVKKSKKAKKAALAATTTTEPTTTDEMTLADIPNVIFTGETSAATAPKPTTPKTPAAPSERTAKILALLSRPEGATIRELVAAGINGSAISSLRSAEKNGYEVRIEKPEGGFNRYYATRKAG